MCSGLTLQCLFCVSSCLLPHYLQASASNSWKAKEASLAFSLHGNWHDIRSYIGIKSFMSRAQREQLPEHKQPCRYYNIQKLSPFS